MNASTLALLLIAAAACRSTRPLSPGGWPALRDTETGTRGDAGPSPSVDAGAPLSEDAGIPGGIEAERRDALGAADAAAARGDIDSAIKAWESPLLRTASLAIPSLVRAARARRARVAAILARPDASAALPTAAREAKACAADAHGAWSSSFPSAGADLEMTHSAAETYAQVGDSGAEALYLEAVCSAAWARTQGFTQLVERRAELIEELKRAESLSPGLDDAGPDRELGKLFVALPSYAGGDLTEASRHFEAAIARAPDAAANHLEFARTVAVKAQDRQLFETQLRLAGGSFPSKDVAAAIADLLGREEDLFDPSEAAQPTPGGPQR